MYFYSPSCVAGPIIREVLEDRLYRYFAPPNVLLPEGSLPPREHVGPHPSAVLDMALVHDLKFYHKAKNQKYQHQYGFLDFFHNYCFLLAFIQVISHFSNKK